MKILITGISGFIGANLASTLSKNGQEVHGIVRHGSKNFWRLETIRSRIAIHEGDILNREFVQGLIKKIKPEVVYHLAVYGAYPHQQDRETILRSSVMTTLYLLEAAATVGTSMFINIGSSSEYGAKDLPMRETDPLEPNNYYAMGKAAQSLLCQVFSAREKLPIITLRPFSVYGPYEEPGRLIPTAIIHALENKDIPLASPETGRDFIYIDDVVNSLILASKRPDLSGNIFNIGSGHQETLRSCVQTIMEITKSSARILWNAYPPRPFDTHIWVADTTKAKELLNFSSTVPLRSGIEKTVEWLKDNKQFYTHEERYTINK